MIHDGGLTYLFLASCYVIPLGIVAWAINGILNMHS